VGERLVTNFDYRLKREKACVHVLDFPVFKQFIFLLKLIWKGHDRMTCGV